MKKLLKVLLAVLCAVLAVVLVGFLYIVVNEYSPADVEALEISGDDSGVYLPADDTLRVVSWNIGYCGLGKGSDFFMDGGENVKSADEATVTKYLGGVKDFLSVTDADLVMLQEVDTDSARTYHIDMTAPLAAGSSVHALNYSCVFVPIPLPPIGQVSSGLFTTTDYTISQAERVSLPCPFSWPVSAANLKRCLLVSYLPIDGSDKQLILVNLHLEAYDDGEGKIAQTKQLREFVQAEYEKGNYVIAGGDFNQIFPHGLDAFPNEHGDLWSPGILDESMLPGEGWQFAYDLDTPSCRLLNQPYDPTDTENTQYYVIDGFILSPNVQLETLDCVDLGFENSDHNPVVMEVRLK